MAAVIFRKVNSASHPARKKITEEQWLPASLLPQLAAGKLAGSTWNRTSDFLTDRRQAPSQERRLILAAIKSNHQPVSVLRSAATVSRCRSWSPANRSTR